MGELCPKSMLKYHLESNFRDGPNQKSFSTLVHSASHAHAANQPTLCHRFRAKHLTDPPNLLYPSESASMTSAQQPWVRKHCRSTLHGSMHTTPRISNLNTSSVSHCRALMHKNTPDSTACMTKSKVHSALFFPPHFGNGKTAVFPCFPPCTS